MRVQLTTKGIDHFVTQAVTQPSRKRIDYFDLAHPGLCVTIGPSSATWFRFMRIAGKLTRIKLGEYPALSLAEARKAHAAQDDLVEAGKHPIAEAKRQRAEVVDAIQADKSLMLDSLANAWFAHHKDFDPRGQRRDKSLSRSVVSDYQRHIAKLCAKFPNRDVRTMSRKELRDYLLSLSGNSDANTCAVVVRQLFQYARDSYDIPNNPAFDLRNPSKQRHRDRTLDPDEIRALWEACKVVGYPYGHALRLALCTAQRIGEIGAIKRGDIKGEWWVQSTNKADRRIDVFLAPLARKIIADCPDFGPDAFLLSASGGTRGLRSDVWSAARPRFVDPRFIEQRRKQGFGSDEKPERERWTPHDIRRTVRSALTGECGVTPDTAERVLNHALPGLRRVYDHADYRPQVRAALSAWNKRLAGIIGGEVP